MVRNGMREAAALVAGLALAAGLAGCMIHTEKDANGKDKNVQVDTPFGGVHVNTDQTTATDLGLPVYPGAAPVKDKDNNKSADVHLGFGEWQLRVRAVSYETPDSEEKVTAFYKKALGRYGDVITCKDNSPVGAPAATHEAVAREAAEERRDHVGDVEADRGDRGDGSVGDATPQRRNCEDESEHHAEPDAVRRSPRPRVDLVPETVARHGAVPAEGVEHPRVGCH